MGFRRLSLLLTTLCAVAILFQLYSTELLSSVQDVVEIEKRALSTTAILNMTSAVAEVRNVVQILIVSSMPRSGSTFLGELLSTMDFLVYFFEPLHDMEKRSPCIYVPTCVSHFIEGLFKCHITPEYESWLKHRGSFFKFFSDKINRCYESQNSLCLWKEDLIEACEAAKGILIKTIRARIGWFQSLLSDPSMNLKIIHLVRDPRGSLTSIRKFGPSWDQSPRERCLGVASDLVAFDYLKTLYPQKLIQVTYEALCVDPLEIAKSLSKFLFDDPNLQERTLEYLNNHTRAAIMLNAMSTSRDSSTKFQEWRLKIKEDHLKSIESDDRCKKSIELLKYRLLGNINNARNLSIPIFLN